MFKITRSFLLMNLLMILAAPVRADQPAWEYQVVILQGVSMGGRIEKQASGASVDTMKTRILNQLAADGWEVLAVVGAPVSDHAVYLRRSLKR